MKAYIKSTLAITTLSLLISCHSSDFGKSENSSFYSVDSSTEGTILEGDIPEDVPNTGEPSNEDPVETSGGIASGSVGGVLGGSSSGGNSGGSSGDIPSPCTVAMTAQSCIDLKCQPVYEGEDTDIFITCVPPTINPVSPMTPGAAGCDASSKPSKVVICHQQGNGAYHSISISCRALKPHLDHHNDSVGACSENQ
jgi:hypothetical protein